MEKKCSNLENCDPNESQCDIFDDDVFYNRIINEAPYIPGISLDPHEEIPWADPSLIKSGQKFVADNSFSIFIAHLAALLYGFSFKGLSAVLMRTGQFGDPAKSILRHIETGLYVNNWYESQILDPKSSGFASVQLVRKLHMGAASMSRKTPLNLLNDDEIPDKEDKLKIAKALKMDLDSGVDTSDSPSHLFGYTPKLFFSQYDMLMTQFGFIIMVYLVPCSLGIRDKKNMDGFLHVWAVLGRMLGIEDRFNLALHPSKPLFMKLFNKLGMANLKELDLNILHLQQCYIDALVSKTYLKTTSLKSSLYIGLRNKVVLPEVRTDNFWAIMSWRDKLHAQLTIFALFLMYHLSFFRWALNTFHNWYTKRQQMAFVQMQEENGRGQRYQFLKKSSKAGEDTMNKQSSHNINTKEKAESFDIRNRRS